MDLSIIIVSLVMLALMIVPMVIITKRSKQNEDEQNKE